MQSWRGSLVLLKKSLKSSSRKLVGTISSVLTMKTMYPDWSEICHQGSRVTSRGYFENIKKAAMDYNKEHK